MLTIAGFRPRRTLIEEFPKLVLTRSFSLSFQ